MAMTAMRARSSPYSTMLAPRSPSALNFAWSQVLRMNRSMVLVQAAVDRGELGGDAGPEGLDGHDGDDGNEGQEQAVLHHARTGLVAGVELGVDPGLENEKVHVVFSSCRRRGAVLFPAAVAPLLRLDALGIDGRKSQLHRPIDSIIGRAAGQLSRMIPIRTAVSTAWVRSRASSFS